MNQERFDFWKETGAPAWAIAAADQTDSAAQAYLDTVINLRKDMEAETPGTPNTFTALGFFTALRGGDEAGLFFLSYVMAVAVGRLAGVTPDLGAFDE